MQFESPYLTGVLKKVSDPFYLHDPASAKDEAPPTPDELKQDVDALRTLIQSVKNKRRGAAKRQGNQASPS